MSDLVVERRDGVVTLTLDRADKLNAITSEMWDGLRDVFAEVARTHDDRVLVVTGRGRGFCAGADLLALRDPVDGADRLERMRRIGRSAAALRDIGKPTIAKVNGVAAGAGLSLALGCDLVIASQAARFSVIFAQRGLSVDYGASWLLPRLVGLHKAKELAFLADVIDAADAERIGIVNRVVPAAELDDVVDTLAARLAATAPTALTQTKRLLDQAFAVSFAEAVEAEATAQVVSIGSDDAKEAMRAFTDQHADGSSRESKDG